MLAAELERVRILETGKQQTAYSNQQKFLALQSEAQAIFKALPKPKKGKPLDISNLKAGDAHVLVRYVYKADGREGISKQPTAKQASMDFLNELEKDQLKTLLEEPPLLADAPLLAAPTTATTTGEQPFHIKFGKVDANMGGLVPIARSDSIIAAHSIRRDRGRSNRDRGRVITRPFAKNSPPTQSSPK